MQIQPSMAAGAAAGSVAQAGSKDRAAASLDSAGNALAATVERVARGEGAQADRDAQGGGQGLGHQGAPPDETAQPNASAVEGGLAVRAPEPPSQLDIIG